MENTLNNKKNRVKQQSRLDEVKHAPALVQAQQIQKNAAQMGFDFHTVQGAYGKLEEELARITTGDSAATIPTKYWMNLVIVYFL